MYPMGVTASSLYDSGNHFEAFTKTSLMKEKVIVPRNATAHSDSSAAEESKEISRTRQAGYHHEQAERAGLRG